MHIVFIFLAQFRFYQLTMVGSVGFNVFTSTNKLSTFFILRMLRAFVNKACSEVARMGSCTFVVIFQSANGCRCLTFASKAVVFFLNYATLTGVPLLSLLGPCVQKVLSYFLLVKPLRYLTSIKDE